MEISHSNFRKVPSVVLVFRKSEKINRILLVRTTPILMILMKKDLNSKIEIKEKKLTLQSIKLMNRKLHHQILWVICQCNGK